MQGKLFFKTKAHTGLSVGPANLYVNFSMLFFTFLFLFLYFYLVRIA